METLSPGKASASWALLKGSVLRGARPLVDGTSHDLSTWKSFLKELGRVLALCMQQERSRASQLCWRRAASGG